MQYAKTLRIALAITLLIVEYTIKKIKNTRGSSYRHSCEN